MKICVIMFTAMLSACMAHLDLNPREQCATQGMYLTGMSMGTASGFAVNNRGGWGIATGYSQAALCGLPLTVEQRCEVAANQAAVAVKANYSPGAPNVVLFLGYSLYVLPGIIFYCIFDHMRDNVIAESVDAAASAYANCIRLHKLPNQARE